MPPSSNPHPTFRTDLNEKDRKSEWAKAAGTGKSPAQHANTRKKFTRKANEDATDAKNGVGLDEKDLKVLERKKHRVSKKAASNHARLKIPENREKENARNIANTKARADALQAEREVEFKENGAGRTTEFGLGDVPRSDELNERVHDIMHSSAEIRISV